MWGYPAVVALLAFSGPSGGPTCGAPLAETDVNPHTPGLGSAAGSSIDQCCALCSSSNWCAATTPANRPPPRSRNPPPLAHPRRSQVVPRLPFLDAEQGPLLVQGEQRLDGRLARPRERREHLAP
eukprot:scaffold53672_cov59-Phaeocystis_antarctica.AAC.2